MTYSIIFFVFYSFIGWFYESTICSVLEYRKLINRGFLIGPYCPVYGIGAVINITILRDVENLWLILIVSIISSTILEYVTSLMMENLFDGRWWDYSRFPLNINGRVCLYASLFFGMANVFLIKVFHPMVQSFVVMYSDDIIITISAILLAILMIDLSITNISESQTNRNIVRQR